MPPCIPFITTSICASARGTSIGIPRACQTPFLSTRISRVSYLSSRSAEMIAAPVLSERLYSSDVPPRKTPTIVRAIARLYHSILKANAQALPVIRNRKSVRFLVGKKNILFQRFNDFCIAYHAFRFVKFVFYHRNDRNHHTGIFERACRGSQLRSASVYHKHARERPLTVR